MVRTVAAKTRKAIVKAAQHSAEKIRAVAADAASAATKAAAGVLLGSTASCHEAGRTEIEGAGGGPHPIPPLRDLIELHERLALPARPARVAAVALNTRALGEEDARAAVAAAEAETGLPADDPVRFGAAKLVDAVLAARI